MQVASGRRAKKGSSRQGHPQTAAWVEAAAGADRPSEKQSEAPDRAKNRGECLGGDRARDVMCEEIRRGGHAMNPAKKERATRLEMSYSPTE